MGRLLKSIWNFITVAKNAFGNILFIALIFLVAAMIFSQRDTDLPDKTALVLNPSGVIVEQRNYEDPINQFIADYDNGDSETLLKDILESINKAADDDRIPVLVLDLQRMRGASLSKLQEIGVALENFKLTGKLIYAYADSYDQAQYFLAAHADHIYLSDLGFGPFSGVLLPGYGMFPAFYRSALEKLQIDMHVFRVGTYKSAVEPYIRDDMSPEAKRANQAWLDNLWGEYRDAILRLRQITADDFDRYTNEYDVLLKEHDSDASKLAINAGFVDERLSQEAWNAKLAELVGEQHSRFTQTGFKNYLRAIRPPFPEVNPLSDKVAVIVAKGLIYSGKRPSGNVGAESTSKLIQQARNDSSVKALVMRVDSPGGSALASEQIRRELVKLQEAGKPLVVSMGSYAASGGYWISANADRILAASTTVTGSIGIYGLLPTFQDSLESLGIHTDGVGTTAMSGGFDPFMALTPTVENIMQQSVDSGYEKFINLVAEGRSMTPEAVDTIGQGRVWTGKTALELGLVDALGHLEDAIKVAADLSGMESYDVIYIEQELTRRERIMNEIFSTMVRYLGPLKGMLANANMLSRLTRDVGLLTSMNDPKGLYSLCLQCSVR